MARDDESEFCGSCNKSFKEGDISVNCELYCSKWFHIKCVNITTSDYDKIQSLGNNSRWFCTPCEKTFQRRNKDKQVCCECFSYITILTDSLKELSDNQKEMSDNLNQVRQEQSDMKKSLKIEVKPQVEQPRQSSAKMFSTVLKSNKSNEKRSMTSVSARLSQHIDCGQPSQLNNNSVDRSEVEMTETNTADADTVGVNDGEWKTAGRKRNFHNTRKLRENSNGNNSTQRYQEGRGTSESGSRYSGASSRRTFVVGSCEAETDLKTVDRKGFLFVSRISPEFGDEDMKGYLTNVRKCTDVIVEKLTSKHPEVYSSFKIGLPSSMIKSAFSAQFWPKGTFVSRFFTNKDHLNSIPKRNTVNK